MNTKQVVACIALFLWGAALSVLQVWAGYAIAEVNHNAVASEYFHTDFALDEGAREKSVMLFVACLAAWIVGGFLAFRQPRRLGLVLLVLAALPGFALGLLFYLISFMPKGVA